MSISHGTLFEVIWFYIVLCIHLKVVEGPLWHIRTKFLLHFEKHATCFRDYWKCGFRMVHQQKHADSKYETQRRAPWHLLKKGSPKRQPSSPPLISTPALNHMQQAHIQLGTPGGENSFLRSAQIFKQCPIVSNYG